MTKTKFIIFDGVDEVGKTTFIEQIKANPACADKVVELNFPKVLPSGELLRINDEKSFELLFSVFEYLDPSYTYILDRFITSNLVYDRVLRNEKTSISSFYWGRFIGKFNVKQFIFTRPYIDHDFVDDKIRMPMDTFNKCIYQYLQYGTNHMLVLRENGKIIGVDEAVRDMVMSEAVEFVNE
jgi:hypothetical protein